jgi:hypothetical protein
MAMRRIGSNASCPAEECARQRQKLSCRLSGDAWRTLQAWVRECTRRPGKRSRSTIVLRRSSRRPSSPSCVFPRLGRAGRLDHIVQGTTSRSSSCAVCSEHLLAFRQRRLDAKPLHRPCEAARDLVCAKVQDRAVNWHVRQTYVQGAPMGGKGAAKSTLGRSAPRRNDLQPEPCRSDRMRPARMA